jgi:hypothetical protein
MPADKTLKACLDEARKKYFAKLKPAEPWTNRPKRKPHEVGVFYKICQSLPCEVTNKRIQGWKHIKHLSDGGYIKMKADETVTPGDIFVLISAIKVFQDNQTDIVSGIVDNEELLTVSISYSKFSKVYLQNHDKKMLLRTLENLYSFHAIWYDIDGSVTPTRYLYNFKLDAGRKNLTLTISNKFAGLCEKYGWLINFDKLQFINSPTARALFLYLSNNPGLEFKQETLECMLNMKQGNSGFKRDNKRQLKIAFRELQEASFVSDVQITASGNFKFTYSKSDRSAHKVTVAHTKSDRCTHKDSSETPAETVE